MKTVFPHLCFRALAIALAFACLIVGLSLALAALGGAPEGPTPGSPRVHAMGPGGPLVVAVGLVFLGAGAALRVFTQAGKASRHSGPGKVFRIEDGRVEVEPRATQ